MSNRYIKLLPGLNPKYFIRLKSKSLSFPLDKAHSHYYFERNAIWQGLKVLGLKPGDEVLIPAYNSDTEEQVLEHAGLKLIYFDVNKDGSYKFEEIEKIITDKTKALYLIHYFGFAQDLIKAKKLCHEYSLSMLEDCALSLFSKVGDIYLGETGDVGFFCLRKFLQIPNGGTLVINNEKLTLDNLKLKSAPWFSTWIETKGLVFNYLAQKNKILIPLVSLFKLFTKFFLNRMRTRSGEPLVEKEKFDWRMSSISKYLLNRLDYDKIIKRRQENYSYLKEKLAVLVSTSESIDFFTAKEQLGFVPFCLPIVVDDNLKWSQALKERGVEAGAWWAHDPRPELNLQFENDIWLRKHILEIPIHQELRKKDFDYIVNCITDIINN